MRHFENAYLSVREDWAQWATVSYELLRLSAFEMHTYLFSEIFDLSFPVLFLRLRVFQGSNVVP